MCIYLFYADANVFAKLMNHIVGFCFCISITFTFAFLLHQAPNQMPELSSLIWDAMLLLGWNAVLGSVAALARTVSNPSPTHEWFWMVEVGSQEDACGARVHYPALFLPCMFPLINAPNLNGDGGIALQ